MDPMAHTRTQIETGPDFCYECSEEHGWVEWPCRGSVLAAEIVALQTQYGYAAARLAGWERNWFDVQKPRLDEAVRLLKSWSTEGPESWHERHQQTEAFLALVDKEASDEQSNRHA